MEAKWIFLAILVAFALMSLKLINSLRTMQVRMGVGIILSSYDSPLLFWIVIALQCLAIGALLAIIYVGYFVLPNSV